jgi:hypothetical protein
MTLLKFCINFRSESLNSSGFDALLLLTVIYFRIEILKQGFTIHDCSFFVNKVNKTPRTQLIENSSPHNYWVYRWEITLTPEENKHTQKKEKPKQTKNKNTTRLWNFRWFIFRVLETVANKAEIRYTRKKTWYTVYCVRNQVKMLLDVHSNEVCLFV